LESAEEGRLGIGAGKFRHSFTGGVAVAGGTLSIAADGALGSGMLALGDRSTVALTAGGNYSHALSVAGVSVITVVAGQSVSWSGLIADGASAGSSSSVTTAY
jgi:hypothetical protein